MGEFDVLNNADRWLRKKFDQIPPDEVDTLHVLIPDNEMSTAVMETPFGKDLLFEVEGPRSKFWAVGLLTAVKAAEGLASETDRKKRSKKTADADEKQWNVEYCKDVSLERSGPEVGHDVPKWLLSRSTP